MKKYTKEIMLVLITAIVVSVISVSATIYFNAENITFVPNNTNWNVSNTNTALNDLYSYANRGDATASNILVGKTALVNGTLITGTMADNGAVTSALNAGGSYTIPVGYHNGSGKITANTLASQTKVDSGKTAIAAAQVLTGYQGWVNGSKITGTMTNRGAVSATINPGGSYTIPAGYHNGSGKVTAANSTSSLSLVGTYTGNQTIDVSSVARTSDTSNNFIVVVTKLNSFDTGLSNAGSVSGYMGASSSGASPAFTYNSTAKTITTTGMSYSATGYCGAGGYKSGSGSITYNVYHI